MKVIYYLKQYGIEQLKQEHSVNVKEYPQEGLLVLNYDQIESPKNEITNECRGLILSSDFKVVSRAFDRFFNYGEQPETQKHLNFKKAVAFDKIDGSLIKIYYYNGKWEIATRGTAFAETGVNGFDITFRDLVLKALKMSEQEFQQNASNILSRDETYICEVTSMENRVVTCYQGYSLYLLAVRDNQTGNYKECYTFFDEVKYPKEYHFSSVDECINTVKNLPDLQEGYVIYQDGVPVCKVKSPAYLACHAIKGEGLTPKRIMDLVIMNEQNEYLAYYPEDQVHFDPYIESFNKMLEDMHQTYSKFKDIEEQKEFALCVKDMPYSSALFIARKSGESVTHCFHSQKDTYKRETLIKFMEKNKQ